MISPAAEDASPTQNAGPNPIRVRRIVTAKAVAAFASNKIGTEPGNREIATAKRLNDDRNETPTLESLDRTYCPASTAN